MKIIFCVAAFLLIARGEAGGGGAGGAASYPQESCSGNKYVKASANQYGEKPDACHVIEGVTLTASTLIDPKSYGNDQGKLTGKGALTNRASEDPNDPKKKKPFVKVKLPGGSASICGVIIGGRTDFKNDYVGSFKLEASADGQNWFKAVTEEGSEVFKGCKAGTETVTNYFMMPVIGSELKITAMSIMPGAAASFRIAVIVNCKYANAVDLGPDCDVRMDSPKYKQFKDQCKKIRLICRADSCQQQRMAWGADPFTTDSPICFTAQLKFSSLGDGNFVAWNLPGREKYGSLERHKLFSLRYKKKGTPGYTFDYKTYKEACP